MSKEIWKEIKGYEGLYQVSNLGRIKSLPKHIGNRYFSKEKIMKPQLINGNRLQVRLSREGTVKNFRVHRLVAENFIKNPYNLPQVNHIDENPRNNNVNNLEWCDAKYNSNYGTRIKRISEKHKKRIISLDNSGKIEYYDSTTEAQQKNNVSRSSIIKCCKQKQKTSLGLRWFYLEDYIKILIDERDKIKQEYDRDTHILQNRLDLVNAENIKKDKQIEQYQNMLVTNDLLHIKESQEKDKQYDINQKWIQKIKDKIEELKAQYKTALEENSTEAFILKCQITILQELIEEREEK